MRYLHNIFVLHPNKGKILWLNLSDNYFANVGSFLFSEASNPYASDYWLEGIDIVLTQKELAWDSGGNGFSVEITQKRTRIHDYYPAEEVESYCTIETVEFKHFIELWVKEIDKFCTIKEKHNQEIDPLFGIYTFLATHFHSKIESSDDAVAEITTRRDRTYIKKATATIKTFLQSKNPVEQKNSYIILCADGINFGSLNMQPLKWLESVQKKLDDHLQKTSWLGKVGSQIKKIWENTTKA